MVKKIGIIVTALLCILILAACGCEHVWQDATCLAPATCSECAETEGEALGHTWKEATCETSKTCQVCGEKEGMPLDHIYDTSGYCVDVCTCCGYERVAGNKVGHFYLNEATCETPKTCYVCGNTDGVLAEHTWVEATCRKVKTCSECNTTEGELADHNWLEADCDNPKRCAWCNKTEGSALGHDFGGSNNSKIVICQNCNKTVELYYPEDGNASDIPAAAWTVYDIGEDGLPVDPISYVYKKGGNIVYKWVSNGETGWYSLYIKGAYTAVDIYYVDGKFYYYHADKYELSENSGNFLTDVAREYVDFAESVWIASKNNPGTDYIDLMPAGWSGMMDDIGSAHLAEDVYGNQYVIVVGDEIGKIAVQRDWLGVTKK